MRSYWVRATRLKRSSSKIGAGAGDGVHFVLPNHFRERNAELGRAHRAGERDHHFPAGVEMRDVSLGRVFQNGGVEMAVMPIDEFADRARFFLRGGRNCFGSR